MRTARDRRRFVAEVLRDTAAAIADLKRALDTLHAAPFWGAEDAAAAARWGDELANQLALHAAAASLGDIPAEQDVAELRALVADDERGVPMFDDEQPPGRRTTPATFTLTLRPPWCNLLELIAADRDDVDADVFGYVGHTPAVLTDALALGLAELARRHGLARHLDADRRADGFASARDELAEIDQRSPPHGSPRHEGRDTP